MRPASIPKTFTLVRTNFCDFAYAIFHQERRFDTLTHKLTSLSETSRISCLLVYTDAVGILMSLFLSKKKK